jgi:hypothetical protein
MHGTHVKYGGDAPGHPEVRETLEALSETVSELEAASPDAEESEAMKSIAAAVALLIGAVTIGRDS